MAADSISKRFKTRIVQVDTKHLGHFAKEAGLQSLDSWTAAEPSSMKLDLLKGAADLLRNSSIPVAFPTETVYGLGADATRSEAVKGIYRVKGRPSDNPLIIHICDLAMLRSIMVAEGRDGLICDDPIPEIYAPLIERFWPGPLTILLPNPEHSTLALEVTAGLKTFGVRMPDSSLALTLIKLAGVPIAAPSANASTKPSTTTAEHVLHDLDGRIELILDGGSCEIGVESTIVDGLCSPPVILRPGGISIGSIRECAGWEGVKIAYKDEIETNDDIPRAPGMKYKHYSPTAKIVLAENGADCAPKDLQELKMELQSTGDAALLDWDGSRYPEIQDGTSRVPRLGIVRTRYWRPWGGFDRCSWAYVKPSHVDPQSQHPGVVVGSWDDIGVSTAALRESSLYSLDGDTDTEDATDTTFLIATLIEVSLGSDTKAIAHGLFSALRELDRRDVDVIYVEGIDDDGRDLLQDSNGRAAREENEGNIAAAIMNRLRKAASVVKS